MRIADKWWPKGHDNNIASREEQFVVVLPRNGRQVLLLLLLLPRSSKFIPRAATKRSALACSDSLSTRIRPDNYSQIPGMNYPRSVPWSCLKAEAGGGSLPSFWSLLRRLFVGAQAQAHAAHSLLDRQFAAISIQMRISKISTRKSSSWTILFARCRVFFLFPFRTTREYNASIFTHSLKISGASPQARF